ncbi:MAG: T9SS type A sorting domain-containing protein [Flavobacteriales bacterium]
MHNLHQILIIICLTVFSFCGFSQTYIGNITLASQSQVNSFGSNNYSHIVGDLTISAIGSNVTDLTALSSLTQIDGKLAVRGQQILTSLTGLHNIDTVEDLTIYSNNAIITLTGLNGLVHVKDNIYIAQNLDLMDLSGLNNLTYCGEKLSISSNPDLASLHGLENLNESGKIDITGCHDLTSVSAINEINILKGLEINSNSELQLLPHFQNIDTIYGSVRISSNPELTSFSGLDSIQYIDGYLSISNNPLLPNLHGLEALQGVKAYCFVSFMHGLENLEGFNQLKSVGFLGIGNNQNLISFAGLEQLKAITGDNLNIMNNQSLTSISSLSNLSSTVGEINIFSNLSLQSLSGLDSINYVTKINIQGNSVLADYCALSYLVHFGTVQGDFLVNNNQYNPTQQDLLNNECANGVSISEISNNLDLYPNPCKNEFWISTETSKTLQINIRDIQGKEVFKTKYLTNHPLSIQLESGIYFLQSIDENNVISNQKLIVD